VDAGDQEACPKFREAIGSRTRRRSPSLHRATRRGSQRFSRHAAPHREWLRGDAVPLGVVLAGAAPGRWGRAASVTALILGRANRGSRWSGRSATTSHSPRPGSSVHREPGGPEL